MRAPDDTRDAAEPPIVFIVDDDPVVLFVWAGILRAAGHRVEVFDQPAALLSRLSPSDRGCLLIELRTPVLSGLEVQRILREREVEIPVIFVSGHPDVPAAVEAMKRGAVDILSKPVEPEELCAVVAHALRRDARVAAERAARDVARARWSALSPRERDVGYLFARGFPDKQIAAALGTAPSTVAAQRARALQKLHVRSATELASLLAQAGDEG